MQIPHITMQSTFMQTGLQIEDPVQRIEQNPAQMSIKQPQAIVTVNVTPSQLTIDQSEAWAEMDIKPISQRTAENAQQAKQKAMEGLARRARQGDDLMHIERGGNPLAAHAKENSASPKHQTGLGWIPSPFSVKTHYEQAKLQFDVQVQKPQIDAQIGETIHEYTPGSVKVSVTQKNSLQIEVANTK